MPINKCQRKKKQGFKYGKKGKCYTGPGAKNKARKQGVAIRISKSKRGLASASKATRKRVARMGGKSK